MDVFWYFLLIVSIRARCGIQYEPNNVHAQTLQYINFCTNPLYYDSFGNSTGANNYSPASPFFSAGTFTQQDCTGIIVSNSTINKLALLSNQVFTVPAEGSIQVKATFSFDSWLYCGVVESPLGSNQDPLYIAGTFGVFDFFNTGWRIMFALTNTLTYALYAKSAGSFQFTYLVPVATRYPEELNTYSIVLNAKKQTISYRIDNKEVLLITPAGTAIDSKFEVGIESGSDYPPSPLPTQFQVLIGTLDINLDPTMKGMHTACQGTVFNQCADNVKFAYKTNCKYAPFPPPGEIATFFTTSIYKQISVTQWVLDEGCPFGGYCSRSAVPDCPQIDRSRLYRHRNYNVPITNPVPLPQPFPGRKPPYGPPNNIPMPAFDCGCGAKKNN